MSYAQSAALQQAIYAALTAHAPLTDLLGDAIHDALPDGPLPPLYATLGPETARDRSDGTGAGARHDFTVSVVATAAGFHAAKRAAAAICDALAGPIPPLTRGRLVGLSFVRAKAARDAEGAARRIDLVYRARVEDG
ncbi:DUF3168 domain-containing protein [Limimaricola pyoseonensis]|uniref:DUF3168 domain-containing protein n=1 Tax=Limimaricola pyoseonensis TaxID=521013 RepID=A0A1G7AZ54_9RHOB|nr:DUF3168 domain-containing protein [Limimaricola pyoseonensis]SDE19295.1 Protein of unknown function [Limimaricola pyoseonensis]